MRFLGLMVMKSITFKIPLTTLMLIGLSFSLPAYSQTSITKTSKLSQEVAKLRPQGQKGLEIFLKSHARELNSSQIRAALDELCQQRDCYASKLYWYTDLEQAKSAAKATGRPILSLRLLGNLNTDLSCANSRFFRVELYPNAEIAKKLREDFILHWQSVRPVPKVTIDFGDGRKLQRTITGNSIHYILDSSGRPIDAIPGLYGPKAFLNQLQQAQAAAKEFSKLSGREREAFLRQYHRRSLDNIRARWTADLSRLGIQSPPRLLSSSNNLGQTPTAGVAGSLAVAKMRVETPILKSLQPQEDTSWEITDRATWNRIAQLYAADAKLDGNSIALIRAKKFQSGKNAQADLSRLIRNFEAAMAVDTVRNEFMLHRRIHQWFVQSNQTDNVESLNEKVYAELFLTPSSDPWLGLAPEDIYSAIDNEGVRP